MSATKSSKKHKEKDGKNGRGANYFAKTNHEVRNKPNMRKRALE